MSNVVKTETLKIQTAPALSRDLMLKSLSAASIELHDCLPASWELLAVEELELVGSIRIETNAGHSELFQLKIHCTGSGDETTAKIDYSTDFADPTKLDDLVSKTQTILQTTMK